MEIKCDTCLSIFTDKISYDIHIKLLKCVSGNNDNNKNYYSCPVCDRQFRLLSNLQRHQETVTHQEILEKIIAQENIITEDDTKIISIDLTPRRKELSLEDMDKLNQEKQKKYNDDVNENVNVNEKVNENANVNEKVNENVNENVNVNLNVNENGNANVNENIDMFLIQLKKQRELDLLPQSQPKPQPQTFAIEKKTNNKSLVLNTNVYIAEEPGFNLALELQKTKQILSEKPDDDTEINYNNEDDFLNIFKVKQKELQEQKKEKDIPITMSKKQPQQITKINNPIEIQNNNLYPPAFKKTPVWEKLSGLIKNNLSNSDINVIATRFILALLVNAPLKDYLIICTYVYYSEDLNKNKEVRISMIKGMIEVYNNYIKLAKNRQMLWNNKNVGMAINIMNNWKMDLFLSNLAK